MGPQKREFSPSRCVRDLPILGPLDSRNQGSMRGRYGSTSEQNANSKIFLAHVTLFCTEPCFERCVNVFLNIIAARVNVCLGKRRRFRGKLCGPLKIHYRIRHLSKKEHNVKLANVPLGIKASKRSMYKS